VFLACMFVCLFMYMLIRNLNVTRTDLLLGTGYNLLLGRVSNGIKIFDCTVEPRATALGQINLAQATGWLSGIRPPKHLDSLGIKTKFSPAIFVI